jgi:nitroreductase
MKLFTESFELAWLQRYGQAPSADLPEVSALFLRHRTVRKYASTPIPDSINVQLQAAAQSAATSSHLQAWSAVEVRDHGIREAIAVACGDQNQVRTAARFYAFCMDHHRLRLCAEANSVDPDGLDTQEMMLVSAVDAALAAERMVVAAESLGIGTCYIGALRNQPERIADLLRFPLGVVGLFGLCLGYPANEARASIKPRFRQEDTFPVDGYPAEWTPADFDERMTEFYQAEGMNSSEPWSQKTTQRIREKGLSGRDRLGEFLRTRGFGIR